MEEIETGEPLAQLARLFKVTLFTGMREGEGCGLSWDAVNFRDGVITVKQQLQKGKEKGSPHYIAATKNDRVRTITVAPFVMSVLQEQFKEQRKEHLAAGLAWQNEWNLCFTYPNGDYIPPQTALKHFKKKDFRVMLLNKGKKQPKTLLINPVKGQLKGQRPENKHKKALISLENQGFSIGGDGEI